MSNIPADLGSRNPVKDDEPITLKNYNPELADLEAPKSKKKSKEEARKSLKDEAKKPPRTSKVRQHWASLIERLLSDDRLKARDRMHWAIDSASHHSNMVTMAPETVAARCKGERAGARQVWGEALKWGYYEKGPGWRLIRKERDAQKFEARRLADKRLDARVRFIRLICKLASKTGTAKISVAEVAKQLQIDVSYVYSCMDFAKKLGFHIVPGTSRWNVTACWHPDLSVGNREEHQELAHDEVDNGLSDDEVRAYYDRDLDPIPVELLSACLDIADGLMRAFVNACSEEKRKWLDVARGFTGKERDEAIRDIAHYSPGRLDIYFQNASSK
jgi:hypothetical protein